MTLLTRCVVASLGPSLGDSDDQEVYGASNQKRPEPLAGWRVQLKSHGGGQGLVTCLRLGHT
jgi:hypothetical protein